VKDHDHGDEGEQSREVPPDEATGGRAVSHLLAERQGASPVKRGTVLVVDDEEGIRRMAARILRRAGYEVILAADGDQALALFDEQAIDVVLLDVSMPQRSGAEILTELRRRRPGLPVLLSSGHSEDTARKGIEQPTGFVGKPYGMEDLLAAVEAARSGAPKSSQSAC